MRYLVQNCFSNELAARRQYIANCLYLWCSPVISIKGFQALISIPPSSLDVLFIVGHNIMVSHYLHSQYIPEESIVAITCGGTIDLSGLKSQNKTIYLPKQNTRGYADLLKGNMFGFNFDLTESEIHFYNTRRNTDIIDRLNTCFIKL